MKITKQQQRAAVSLVQRHGSEKAIKVARAAYETAKGDSATERYALLQATIARVQLLATREAR